jgi:hypothetical protein
MGAPVAAAPDDPLVDDPPVDAEVAPVDAPLVDPAAVVAVEDLLLDEQAAKATISVAATPTNATLRLLSTCLPPDISTITIDLGRLETLNVKPPS